MMIGAPLWYGGRPYRKVIEALHDIGFDYVEFSLDYPLPDGLDDLNVAKEIGIELAFHAPIEIFLAHPRDEIFKASLKVFERCMEATSKFEPVYFNFHLFHSTTTHIFPEVREKIRENGLKACKVAVELSKELGFPVCLENDGILDDLFLSIEGLMLTLDIGHIAVKKLRRGEDYIREIKEFVKRFDRKILVCHIHNVDLRTLNDHISLSSGDLNLREVVSILGSRKFYLIETFWKDGYRKEKADVDSFREDLKFLKELLK